MIDIACAADEAYVPHCAAMLDSVFSVHEKSSIRVHFLHDSSLSDNSLGLLEKFVLASGNFWNAYLVSDEEKAKFPSNRRFGEVAWYRVLLPDLIKGDSERVLYLDADTLVLRSLKPLWETELHGFPLGAVINPLYPFMDTSFLRTLEVQGGDYFNSGVLLLQLSEWKRLGLSGRLLNQAWVQANQEWPDQNALNVVFRKRWFRLDAAWNAQNTIFDLPPAKLPLSRPEVERAKKHPAIVHFIGPYKPWHCRCRHKYRSLYWFHLSHTPWAGRVQMQGVSWRNRILRWCPPRLLWWLSSQAKRVR